MLYRHVFDKISTEFRGFSRVFANFAGFRSSATERNIRSPVYSLWLPQAEKFMLFSTSYKSPFLLYLKVLYSQLHGYPLMVQEQVEPKPECPPPPQKKKTQP